MIFFFIYLDNFHCCGPAFSYRITDLTRTDTVTDLPYRNTSFFDSCLKCFCRMRTALAEGIGEKLTALPPMPKCPVLIAKPAISVSTKTVYEALKLYDGMEHPDIDGVMESIQQKDLNGVASHMGNILETVTIPMYPVIKDIKKLMMDNGALNAMMSGSGPTVFGLFPNEKEIRRAYDALKQSGLAKNVYTSDIHNNRR